MLNQGPWYIYIYKKFVVTGSLLSTETINTVSDNYASAEVAFMYPSKLHECKNKKLPYARPLLKEFINTFVVKLSHLSDENFTFKTTVVQSSARLKRKLPTPIWMTPHRADFSCVRITIIFLNVSNYFCSFDVMYAL